MNPNQFPDADRIRTDLEDGSGLFRLKVASEETLSSTASEWFLSLANGIGTPVPQSASGELILSIRNESYGHNDYRTRGPNTNRKLGFHTDRCDVIGFLCLQAAKSGGENQVVSSPRISKIIRQERPDLHETLCQPFPYKRHVVDKGNALPYCVQPVFSWKDNHFACSYLRVLIDRADQDAQCPGLSNDQREALDFLDSVCEREMLQTRFTLKRGELLFLNNWTTLHRRTAFEDFEEAEKRKHLLRVWLSVPNSRPVDESFRANFGAVEAGAIRGGMQPCGER
jgi:hypothetical protein